MNQPAKGSLAEGILLGVKAAEQTMIVFCLNEVTFDSEL